MAVRQTKSSYFKSRPTPYQTTKGPHQESPNASTATLNKEYPSQQSADIDLQSSDVADNCSKDSDITSLSSSHQEYPCRHPIDDDFQRREVADNYGEDCADCKSYPCVSARQPYAGLILNGYKTVETRWTPLFKEFENQTVAIHIAQRLWDGSEWKEALRLRGLSDAQIECLIVDAETFGRGVIAGLVDIGKTWQCITNMCSESERADWEKKSLLKPLEEKYLTTLNNPRWLKRPIKSRGHKGAWTVRIHDTNIT